MKVVSTATLSARGLDLSLMASLLFTALWTGKILHGARWRDMRTSKSCSACFSRALSVVPLYNLINILAFGTNRGVALIQQHKSRTTVTLYTSISLSDHSPQYLSGLSYSLLVRKT